MAYLARQRCWFACIGCNVKSITLPKFALKLKVESKSRRHFKNRHQTAAFGLQTFHTAMNLLQ